MGLPDQSQSIFAVKAEIFYFFWSLYVFSPVRLREVRNRPRYAYNAGSLTGNIGKLAEEPTLDEK